MKTKTNKVPLVGPKGRRELLDRIEELEKELEQKVNQSYDVITPKIATDIPWDAYAIGQLRNSIDQNTILNTKLLYRKGTTEVYNILSSGNGFVTIFKDSAPYYTRIVVTNYSVEQYDGLAKVQEAVNLTNAFPEIGYGSDDESLAETNTGKYLCVEDKLVKPNLDDADMIIGFTISEQSPEGEYVNISSDDLQKLVGFQL